MGERPIPGAGLSCSDLGGAAIQSGGGQWAIAGPRVKVKSASISKAVGSRCSRFNPKNVDCQLSIAPSENQGGPHLASLTDNRLRFQKFPQSQNTSFPADPGLLEATERRERVVAQGVDQQSYGLKLSRYAVGPFDIRRADVSHESVFRVVREPNGFGFSLVCQY